MEMLVVIVIIAVLIGMLSGAYLEAKNHAKRARAETQLRELVKAWTEYYEANNTQWPSTLNNQSNVPMTYTNLQYLFASGNTNNIPFIAINLQSGDTYSDPWGNPYKISFGTGQDQQESALRIAVSFPNRDRYR